MIMFNILQNCYKNYDIQIATLIKSYQMYIEYFMLFTNQQ